MRINCMLNESSKISAVWNTHNMADKESLNGFDLNSELKFFLDHE